MPRAIGCGREFGRPRVTTDPTPTRPREVSEEEVEAAAREMNDTGIDYAFGKVTPWERLDEDVRRWYRDCARKILAAAVSVRAASTDTPGEMFTMYCAVPSCDTVVECPVTDGRMDIRPLTGWEGPPMVCPKHRDEIEPLRAASTESGGWRLMCTKNNPGAFDCYEAAAPDEPMFVLLARDVLASDLVYEWARRREVVANVGSNPDQSELDKIAEARACADAMREWHGLKTQTRAGSTEKDAK